MLNDVKHQVVGKHRWCCVHRCHGRSQHALERDEPFAIYNTAVVKFLKDKQLKKVQAAIQGDQVRVSSASKDELQLAIQHLREHDFGLSLQFGNYR